MCIAILNLKNELSKETISNSFKNNSQGSGLLYSLKGRLKTFKTHNFEDFYKHYVETRKKIKTPIVLHFRIATSGFSDLNLHPFLVNESLGFVHNGVIYGLGTQLHSDTYQFNEILQKLPIDFLNNESIIDLIKLSIGTDKLIFLDADNNYTIINDHLGHYDNLGNWFSNSSYKKVNNYEFFGNKKVYKTNYLDRYEKLDYYENNLNKYDAIYYDKIKEKHLKNLKP